MRIASPTMLTCFAIFLPCVASGSAQGPAAAEADRSLTLPEAPGPAPASAGSSRKYPGASTAGFIPTRNIGVTLVLGSGGVGVELTRPIAPRFALRAGASFLSVDGSFVEKNVNIDGNLKLQNAFAGGDFYPLHNSFRITPGLSFANRTTANATLFIPGGRSFSFGDGENSTSDPQDPVRGTAQFFFGGGISPRLTAGWANAIPHRNPHFSFPVELGFEYIAQPRVKLNITGSGCQIDAGTTELDCGPVDQSDIVEEQRELMEDVKPLRVFPMVSIGVTYWFGHVRRHN